MKKCTKCGAINDNLYTSCIDCGAPLGPPLSKAELSEDGLYKPNAPKRPMDKSDYFYVSKADKMIAILLLAGVVLQFLLVTNVNPKELSDYTFVVWIIVVWMLIEVISLMFPKLVWKLYELSIPRKALGSKKLKPTDMALYLRKGLAYSSVFVGYALIIVVILDYYL